MPNLVGNSVAHWVLSSTKAGSVAHPCADIAGETSMAEVDSDFASRTVPLSAGGSIRNGLFSTGAVTGGIGVLLLRDSEKLPESEGEALAAAAAARTRGCSVSAESTWAFSFSEIEAAEGTDSAATEASDPASSSTRTSICSASSDPGVDDGVDATTSNSVVAGLDMAGSSGTAFWINCAVLLATLSKFSSSDLVCLCLERGSALDFESRLGSTNS